MNKHLLRLTVATIGFAVPWTAFSAAFVSAHDTVAGLGAEITASGLSAKTQYELVVIPPEGHEEVYAVSTDTQGKISKFVPGSVTQHAGMYDVIVAQGVRDIAQTSFEVLPDTMDPTESFIDLLQDTIVADGRDEAEVIVVLMDRFGNPLPGRPVELIGSGYETIDPLDNETDRYGEQHFIVTTRTPGSITLRAMDLLSADLLTARAEIFAEDGYGMGGHQTLSRYRADLVESAYAQSDDYDVINRFKITFDPATLEMREVARNVLIQAVDRNGNIVRDYTGTVRISSPTDPTAVLPGFGDGFGETTFTERDRGEKNLRLVVSFQRAGEQTLKVEDLTNPAAIISGQSTVNVTATQSGGEGGAIRVTSHANGDTISSSEFTITGTADPFINLRVMVDGKDITQGDTDATGTFTIPVTLDPEVSGKFNLRIQDPVNGQDSGTIELNLDTEAPEVTSFTFAPEKPEEGSEILISVKSEPGLSEVIVKIDGETHTLAENPKNSGNYQAAVTATKAGAYQPSVIIKDKGGNTRELKTTLVITPKGLPKVMNVKVEARANAVEITWEPIKGETVDAYRIYVGEEDGNFLYTLDTQKPTASVGIAGLRAATTYFFAVTAIKGDRESSEKSETVSTLVLGTKLEIEEQDGALLLQWSFPEEKPLSSFLLEYGTEKGVYSERRVLNGALRVFTLRDLLNGVTYSFRLTPVATTGDLLSDLAATGQGTPSGTGFHASAPDPLPFDPDDLPPANELHEGAPKTPTTGLPPVALYTGFAAAVFFLGLQWHRRRTLKMTSAFIKTMEENYRRS